MKIAFFGSHSAPLRRTPSHAAQRLGRSLEAIRDGHGPRQGPRHGAEALRQNSALVDAQAATAAASVAIKWHADEQSDEEDSAAESDRLSDFESGEEDREEADTEADAIRRAAVLQREWLRKRTANCCDRAVQVQCLQ